MTTDLAGRPDVSGRRRTWHVIAIVAAAALVLLVCVGWWAGLKGYVSWGGTACTDEGYEPVPSYQELVTEHRKSPYCARLARDETWF
jgi:hypothetical protein